MEIHVSSLVYAAAKEGACNVITTHLDPAAEKAILEGARPTQVTIRERGSRRKPITFAVIGAPSRVLKGYTVIRKGPNDVLHTMVRDSARIVIGEVIDPKERHEAPPE